MEVYNVKEVIFRDGTIDTRIYLHDVFIPHKIERKKKREEIPEDEQEDNLRRSASRAKQKIYEISRNEIWEWFVTLTLSPQKVDRFNYGECCKKVSQWLNNLRKKCPDLKYIVVPEEHEKGGYHFHGLFSGISEDMISYSGHDHYKTGDKIYNLASYKFGWSTMTKVKNNEACVKYLTKYITKDLIQSTKGRKKYWVSRNVERPCTAFSFQTDEDRCFLWQELSEDAVYMKEYQNKYNDIMYFQNR